MDRKLILFLLILPWIIAGCKKTDKEIIEKSIYRLNSLKTVGFEQRSHFQHKDMQMNRIDSAYCFYEFTNSDTLLGIKYQIVHNEGEQVFNGNQIFDSNNNRENVIYNENPSMHDVCSSIFLLNSICVIKRLLPEMINDTSVVFNRLNDTIISNQNCYSFSIEMKNKRINPVVGYKITASKGTTSRYTLRIYQKSSIPAQFTEIFANGKGSWESTFSDINLNLEKGDFIWSYERFPGRYLRLSKSEYFAAMQTKTGVNFGVRAPLWKLPAINGDSMMLSKNLGKLVLLEFWFPYCKGCVQSVPVINEIYKQFRDKGLTIFGIEFTHANKKVLEDYIGKQKIEYPTLFNGRQVSIDYGVNAAPAFFLIDKKGKIVYTNLGLNKKELIAEINKNL